MADANEATMQQYVVLPILRALGWDDANLASMEVLPEYKVENKRADYTLQVKREQNPIVVIECKRWGQSIEKYEGQICFYAYSKDIPLAIITNGKIWRFYLSGWKASSLSDRIFCEIDIENRETAVTDLEKYLLKANVISDEAELNAEIALEEKEKTDFSKPVPIPPKPNPANDITDPKPIEREATVAGEWTIDRIKNSLPEEVKRYYEANYSEDRRNIFYGRVTETQNLIQAKGWILDVKFTTRYCGFMNKKRVVFGVRITYSPPRFFAKVTKEEAGSFSNHYEYRYDSGQKSAFYTIPENVSELLPVLEFAYNKHRGK
ncbi:MAG: type I restriction endonuclease [Candidatus Poribacteria bacterium]|nr:type I restriction endonuclease [Candidatus Poribacteria bacterium]